MKNIIELKSEKPHEQRVITEANELAVKTNALQYFIFTEKYRKLPDIDRYLLQQQLTHMEDYHLVLTQRIDNFKP